MNRFGIHVTPGRALYCPIKISSAMKDVRLKVYGGCNPFAEPARQIQGGSQDRISHRDFTPSRNQTSHPLSYRVHGVDKASSAVCR